MKYRLLTLTALAVLLLITPVASAGERGGGLERADANKDGQVTFDELKVVLPAINQERFNKLDSNSDGVLTREDRPLARPADTATRGERPRKAQGLELLKRADKNQDKQVTFEELKAVAPNTTEQSFKRLDRNGDGILSDADGRGVRGEGPVPGAETPIEIFRQADANHDRQVTFDELKAVRPEVTPEVFDQHDRNGDGVLSPADLGAATETPAPSPKRLPDQPPQAQAKAAPPKMNIPNAVLQADANGDGEVSFHEAREMKPDLTQEAFARFDKSGDGVLSLADLAIAKAAHKEKHSAKRERKPAATAAAVPELFRQADADQDNRVTMDEARALKPDITEEEFGGFDINGDGIITAKDFAAKQAKPAAAAPKADSGIGQSVRDAFRRADADTDGTVTLEEARALKPDMTAEELSVFDKNGDGKVSEADFK